MRKILFRGKGIDNNWVIGSLLILELPIIGVQHTIVANGVNHVIGEPETIGQHTGLTDKNGKKIFEGDVVKWDDCSNGKYWRLAVVELKPDIQFNCGLVSSMKGIENSTTDTFRYGNFAYQKTELYLEIVGNFFDN